MTRITLEGWAWRTPLGSGREALDRLRAGESAVRALDRCGVPYGATIPGDPAPAAESRYLHRVGLFALELAKELGEDGDHVGVFAGIGGLRALWGDLGVAMRDQDGGPPWARGLGKVHPYWMLRHLSNNAHALAAQALGARGEGTTVSGATGGAGALAAACRALTLGRLDVALVVAADTLLQPEILLEGSVSGRWGRPGEAASTGGPWPGEAAVAVRLVRDGAGPAVQVSTGLGEPEVDPVVRGLGDLGAATSLAQVVWLAETGGGRATWGGPPGVSATVEVR